MYIALILNIFICEEKESERETERGDTSESSNVRVIIRFKQATRRGHIRFSPFLLSFDSISSQFKSIVIINLQDEHVELFFFFVVWVQT